MKSENRAVKIIYYIGAGISGLMSAFFVFYEARLLYVTKGLTALHKGRQGAYIGAIAFPVIAALFGFITWQCVKTAKAK
ncbi:MAG TPA: hypothetical protein VK141_08640 [Nitrosomonas sp.]|nr:hypothetical protein [Nitrosomonas sp.]